MNTLATQQDREDICLWPDGTWCYRDELSEYSHMSDDYQVVEYNCIRYWELQNDYGPFQFWPEAQGIQSYIKNMGRYPENQS